MIDKFEHTIIQRKNLCNVENMVGITEGFKCRFVVPNYAGSNPAARLKNLG